MTKTELKEKAQHEIMLAAQVAFNSVSEQVENEDLPEEIFDALETQFSRLEKFFGYVVGSWSRGV